MGLTRAMATAAMLAAAFGAGALALPSEVRADGIDRMITPGSVARVQLFGEGRVLTAEEAALMLEAEGFEVIETKRTLLGRIRIVAEGPQGQREIVLNASDGRVLRDLFTESETPAAIIRPAETVVPVVPQVPAVAIAPEPPAPDVEPPVEAPVTEPAPPVTEEAPPPDLEGMAP